MTTSDNSGYKSSPAPSPSASSSSYSWPSPPCSPSPAFFRSPASNVPQFHRLCQDMLSPLPPHLLEPIVNMLRVQDVWSLWQTSCAMQTALEQCRWGHEVMLNDGHNWLLALGMFTPGCVRCIWIGNFAFDRLKSDRNNPFCRRAWERLIAHLAHVEHLNVLDNRVLSSLASPLCPTTVSRSEAAAAVLDKRAANSSWQSQLQPTSPSTLPCATSSSPSLSTLPSREILTWPLPSHFAALRELKCTVNVMDVEQQSSALLPLVSTLTSLTLCRGMLPDTVMKRVMQLPQLKRLTLHDHHCLTLSADVIAWAASLESVELVRCNVEASATRVAGGSSAWLATLRAVTLLDVDVGVLNLGVLAQLPVLHTLTVRAERILRSLPPYPLASTASAAAAAPGPTALIGARGVAGNVISAAPRTQHPHMGSSSVACPPASHCFPCLRSLHLTAYDGAALDFSMFPDLTCLKLFFDDVLSPVGTLASMPLLTSLEVRVRRVPSPPLNSSDLSCLRCLKEVKVHRKAFRSPIDLSALRHVGSVIFHDDVEEGDNRMRQDEAERH